MVNQKYNPKPIEESRKGRIYSISSGNKKNNETIAVNRQEEGSYRIVYIAPSFSKVKEEEILESRKAIKKARVLAKKHISVGFPGSGKIEVFLKEISNYITQLWKMVEMSIMLK